MKAGTSRPHQRLLRLASSKSTCSRPATAPPTRRHRAYAPELVAELRRWMPIGERLTTDAWRPDNSLRYNVVTSLGYEPASPDSLGLSHELQKFVSALVGVAACAAMAVTDAKRAAISGWRRAPTLVAVRSATGRRVSWPRRPSGPARAGSARGGSTRGGQPLPSVSFVLPVQGSRRASPPRLWVSLSVRGRYANCNGAGTTHCGG